MTDPGCAEQPGEDDLCRGVGALDPIAEHSEQRRVLLRLRLCVPEGRRVDLVPQLPIDDRQLRYPGVFCPEGAAAAISLRRGMHECPEIAEAVSRGRVVRPRGDPAGRAVDGGQHPDSLLGGRADDRVVLTPVIGRSGGGLNGAPNEVDAEGPHPAGAHPGDLGGIRIVGRDHAVERTRCGGARLGGQRQSRSAASWQ